MVDIAQLVEPRIVIPVVVGSSPIIHPMSKKAYLITVVGLFFSTNKSFLCVLWIE